MKKIISALLFIAGFAMVGLAQEAATAPVDSANMAVIKFDDQVHDFGKIPYAGDGTHVFVFTNTGKSPLLLTNVRATCGCTIPEWNREPIAPGKSDKITVKYDTRRTGPFTKTVTVQSNASNSTLQLTIKGEVQAQPAGQN